MRLSRSTSFLYGGNARYIEDLYARYAADPRRGRRRVAGLLPQPEGRPGSREMAEGPSWKRARLAVARRATS